MCAGSVFVVGERGIWDPGKVNPSLSLSLCHGGAGEAVLFKQTVTQHPAKAQAHSSATPADWTGLAWKERKYTHPHIRGTGAG